MPHRDSFVLFTDVRQHLDLLSDSELAAFTRAIYRFADTGEIADNLSPAASMAFSFVRSSIDRESAKWQATREQRSRAGALGAAVTNSRRAANAANAASAEQGTANAAVPAPVPVPVPVNEYILPRQTKLARGEFGWVKLSDAEVERLLSDLGEPEYRRCVAYIDESAQATGNRNQWKDWNLVVRKCSREGWGRNRQAAEQTCQVPDDPYDGMKLITDDNGVQRWVRV